MKQALSILLLLLANQIVVGEILTINNCNTIVIPSQIESENYCGMSGIQTEQTQDESGNLNIGYIDDDDWMSYNISVPASGTYTLSYRVASANGGNEIQIDKDKGATVLGTITVPATGGWQTWQTITHDISLPQGEYEIGIKANIGGFNINWFSITGNVQPQNNFLHTSGKNIVDGNGTNILLNAINLDGWMVQEGYIMEVPFGPQWEIEQGIIDVIGEQNKQEFYDAWLDNMVTEADVIQIKEWGFNSIRVPLHYNLFTLPIQEEPVEGQSTVISRGYNLIDNLLAWCKQHQVYLILDLHAAPGGQGEDQPISDYNPAYPSLWESGENRSKTVHLWREIASRYADEEWIAGYDLLNETNWELGDQNEMLSDLYTSILWELRQVDSNHIVFIEGNWWANDFRGLTPAFDNNMVYAFHKYWSDVDQGSIQEFIDLRNSTNTPIWCGETGENSNQWYSENFELLNSNNIGYSFWPLKKINQIQGLLKVDMPQGMQDVLKYWNGEGAKPSVANAKAALMQWATNTRIDNCVYNYSVIDATTRGVGTTVTKAYEMVNIPSDNITAVNYDLGKQGYAYFEQGAVGDYGDGAIWNVNWTFRNDAVDIYQIGGNGAYYIGETKDNEWLKYTVNFTEGGEYVISTSLAANSTGGEYHIEIDGVNVTGTKQVSSTGGWEAFSIQESGTASVTTGTKEVKFVFEKGGFNIKALQFSKTTSETVAVTGLSLSQATANLSVNQSLQLSAAVLPANASDKSVTWTSSNTAVATVSSTGEVITLAEGNVIITAQSSNAQVNALCTITVENEEIVGGCESATPITLNFSYDGVEEQCWVVSGTINYINSWGTQSVTINGVDITNLWVNNFPAKENGKYYITFKGAESWAHIEIEGAGNSNQRESLNSELNKVSSKVYPNPISTGSVHISHPIESLGAEINIFDVEGKNVYSSIVTSEETKIDKKTFNKGLYIITIQYLDKVEKIKLVVQ
ncbi:carbohydrate-binding protein [Flammeovirga kamogawensis]|uniref:Carbohydrate-binding protein n=1 Tax=Flammeovirga kamogawensis TaxID=373891 RepID=A0ABX8GQ04_9BACT|nr:carbohydrate-binding protein [Flammeovirga kamogawensis]MBB6463046.1 uncharacterized protein YjdB/aryl-phospho-beta-D-glucosidase BglC (GH1 family) [Flammeovirga kamogawensis]QWG05683.1 carbohydrate-binding protein [Flammeovirga kamogawensis]TRX67512.1 carbohydrate-binding protein [Flammeovirga kamogawensis]